MLVQLRVTRGTFPVAGDSSVSEVPAGSSGSSSGSMVGPGAEIMRRKKAAAMAASI